MKINRRHLLQSGLAMLAGCGAPLHKFAFDSGDTPSSAPGLQINFFGVTCFLLQWRDTAVLIDPFWTYLPLMKVGFGKTMPDPKQVDKYLPMLGKVESVLVGHSHYDHVLDLPYVAPHLSSGTEVFANQTLAHTLAPMNLPLTFRSVNETVTTAEKMGMWNLANQGRVRILPILSGHPNNYAFIHVWKNRIHKDRSSPPTRAHHFQEGITLAFLVDFLAADGQTIVHRIYVQTSSRGWPDGYFPKAVLNKKKVDVALLAMDCANIESKGRDSIIDFIEPETVLFCHWENFFRTKEQSPREIVKVDVPELKEWFDKDSRFKYRFPGWDTQYFFPDPIRPPA